MSKPRDGGPAFPQTVAFNPNSEPVTAGMYFEEGPGMSLRDWFAGQVACGDAAAGTDEEGGGGWTSNLKVLHEYAKKRAEVYYAVADAMIAERNITT